MKKTILSIFVLGLFSVINATFSACNTEPLVQKCNSKLGDFTFLKMYKVENIKAGENVEYSYVFSGNTTYMLSMSDDKAAETPNLEVNLYDSGRKLVSTNKLNGKTFPAIMYKCSATGIYYMTYTMDNASCGVSVLGFKK